VPDDVDLVYRVSPWLALAGFFVLLVVLLDISAPPVVWIDVTGKSRATAERNRSDLKSLSLLGPAANRQHSSYRRRGSASRIAFLDGPHDARGVKEGLRLDPGSSQYQCVRHECTACPRVAHA
jgi:hypothetical protein